MATQYTLSFQNNSKLSRSFLCFQQDPNLNIPGIVSLAWYSKFTHPKVRETFKWFINYSFLWSETGILKPGVHFVATQTVDADPQGIDDPNQISFQYDQGAFRFGDSTSQGTKGSLTINTGAGFPAGRASIGIGMSGSGTFAVEAAPQDNVIFTPHPQYWVAFGNYNQGDVLDITQISNKKQVIFPPNVYAMTAIYDEAGNWTIMPTSELNAIIANAEANAEVLAKLGYQATLKDGNTATSNGKTVNGVNLKGMNEQPYSPKTLVTVKNKENGKNKTQRMTDQTDENIDLGKGVYSVANNSGGTINYQWL